MKLIYYPWGEDATENPNRFPPKYPRESSRINDEDPIPKGWIEISDAEYKALIAAYYKDVESINSLVESVEKSTIEAKSSLLESTFDQLKSIEEKIKGAGGALDPSDQTALLLYTLEALLLLREPLVQIQKRSL